MAAPAALPQGNAAVAPPAAADPTPTASTSARAASQAAEQPTAAASAEVPPRADNKVLPPSAGADLDKKAASLFEAIVKNDASLAESFWFPLEPFLSVKDIKDAGAYWKQLRRTYAADVERFHRTKKSWDGARFVRFELGTEPTWVKPGEEGNRVGYYRTFRAKLFYEHNGREDHLRVNVIISWQGRWFITHLDKIRR